MRKSDYRMFEEARKEALKSDFPGFKVGCVLCYKGHVIGRGRNTSKTNPAQKAYNRYRAFCKSDKPVRDSMHAEMAAILSVRYAVARDVDWKKVRCYTYRISPGKKERKGLSKPCPACERALRDKGVKELFFSLDEGFGHICFDD